MVKNFFSIFQFDVKDYFINFEISKLEFENFFKICYCQFCSWVLSGYSQGLQIFSPNLTSQILVVFEI